jgi:cytochrome c-type biogenesis protein CcsB
MDLESLSVLLIWTATAIYTLAFISYVIDLASRSGAPEASETVAGKGEAASGDRRAEAEAERRAMSAAHRSGTMVAPPAATFTAGPRTTSPSSGSRFVFARIGTSLTVLAFLFHLGAVLTRGITAGRVPWTNLYEFAMTGTVLIVLIYLVVLFRLDLQFVGAFIIGLVIVLLGLASMNFYVVVTPLADQLKSVWLVIHVFVASAATAFFALAFALSVLQLMQVRRERAMADGTQRTGLRFLATLPGTEWLERTAYRFAIIGFVLWTFTLIAGAIWANEAWSRFWGFDTKEVWTFIVWVLYAGYIHARATRGWRGTRSAWLSIVGFGAVMFNFTIVNMFFKGLHSYSGLN